MEVPLLPFCHHNESRAKEAVVLRSLANYFQCRDLMKAVNQSIQHTLEFFAVEYLQISVARGDEKVEAAAMKYIIEHFDQYPRRGYRTFDCLPAETVRSILSSLDRNWCSHDVIISCVVDFFQKNPDAMSSSLLAELTVNLSATKITSYRGTLRFSNFLTKLNMREEEPDMFETVINLC